MRVLLKIAKSDPPTPPPVLAPLSGKEPGGLPGVSAVGGRPGRQGRWGGGGVLGLGLTVGEQSGLGSVGFSELPWALRALFSLCALSISSPSTQTAEPK